MSRSKNQHDKRWDPPNRFLKKSTKEKRRAAEKRYIDKLKHDPSYYEESEMEHDKVLDNIRNWD